MQLLSVMAILGIGVFDNVLVSWIRLGADLRELSGDSVLAGGHSTAWPRKFLSCCLSHLRILSVTNQYLDMSA